MREIQYCDDSKRGALYKLGRIKFDIIVYYLNVSTVGNIWDKSVDILHWYFWINAYQLFESIHAVCNRMIQMY